MILDVLNVDLEVLNDVLSLDFLFFILIFINLFFANVFARGWGMTFICLDHTIDSCWLMIS